MIYIISLYYKLINLYKMNRCQHCNKKVKLITFSCKCSYKTLCINCKLPETHSCSSISEFKNEAKDIIKKNNPIIISEKLIKI